MKWEGSERRVFVRAQLPCRIVVRTPQEHEIAAQTQNIGAGGVCVLLYEQLEISSVVGLQVFLDKSPICCKGRVVWVVSQEAGASAAMFDTGIEFYQIDENDRLMLGEFIKAIITQNG